MIDEFDDFTTVSLRPIDVNNISAEACRSADVVLLESTAARRDVRVDLFSSTFNALSASRMNNRRS